MVVSKYLIRLKTVDLKTSVINVRLCPDHIFYGEGKIFALDMKNQHG